MEPFICFARHVRTAACLGCGVVVLCVVWSSIGCGPSASSTASNGSVAQSTAQRSASSKPRRPPVAAEAGPSLPPLSEAIRTAAGGGHLAPVAPPSNAEPRTSLGDLLDNAQGGRATAALAEIDDQRVAVAGIRKIEGAHLTLYTDLAPAAAVDELPHVFDLAIRQWADYFHLPHERLDGWRMIGFLMQEENRFRGVGLRPAHLPPFTTGYSQADRFWLFEQPSAYYRRHLMLHEAVHGFMFAFLGGAGPPWYMEGIAERLATHRWSKGVLQTSYLPKDKRETPMWGRVKIVRDAYAAQRGMRLDRILNYGPQAHLQVEPYGWCWAATLFFDQHPLSRDVFQKLREKVDLPPNAFTTEFRAALGDAWPRLLEDWQIFVAELDYGYDVARAVVLHAEAHELGAEPRVACDIQSDHGWQSSGFLLRAGKRYRISAQGKYSLGPMLVQRALKNGSQAAPAPKTWWCEPGGVTLRYYRGAPLGVLSAALRPPHDLAEDGVSALLQETIIGLQHAVQPSADGVLYLRINEAAGGLYDNEGQLHISIERL